MKSQIAQTTSLSRNSYILILFLSFLLNSILSAQVSFAWAKQLRGLLGAKCHAGLIKTDAQGNIYSYGSFVNTVDFDPGPATFTLNSLGDAPYLTKFDPAGNLLWARHFRNPYLYNSSTFPTDFLLDNSGNIFCIGSFKDFNDFDPGPATFTMNPNIGSAYVCKLDGNGNFLWAKQLGDSTTTVRNATFESNGDLLITGIFRTSSNDFDPGPGTYSFANLGGADAYVCKLTPSGTFQWAQQIAGPGDESVSGIQMNATNQVVIGGRFSGIPDFDPGPGTFTLNSNNGSAFFCMLNSGTGSFAGAWQLGNPATSLLTLRKNTSGNLVVMVGFNAVVDADPGPAQLLFTPTGSGPNQFIGEYTATGSMVWAKHLNSGPGGILPGMELDSQGKIYVFGFYGGLVDFAPGPGTYTLTSNSNNNANGFLQCLDPIGNFQWVRQIEGPTFDAINCITFNSAGEIFADGEFSGAGADFDVGPGTYTMSALDRDAFIMKLSPCTLPVSPTISTATLAACDSSNFVLSASPGLSVSWRSALMSNSYLGFGATFTAPVLSLGNYSFYAAQSNTCGESFPPALVQMSVFPTPTINVVPDKNIYCYGESVTLTATGANNYAGANQFFTNTVVVTPVGNVVYTVTGSGAGGCFASTTVALIMVQCTSLNEKQKQLYVEVWPNPSSGQLNIRMQDLTKVELMSIEGRMIFSSSSSENSIHINHLFAPGLYLVKVTNTSGKTFERKVVVE